MLRRLCRPLWRQDGERNRTEGDGGDGGGGVRRTQGREQETDHEAQAQAQERLLAVEGQLLLLLLVLLVLDRRRRRRWQPGWNERQGWTSGVSYDMIGELEEEGRGVGGRRTRRCTEDAMGLRETKVTRRAQYINKLPRRTAQAMAVSVAEACAKFGSQT